MTPEQINMGRMALGYFGAAGGQQAGGFTQSLMRAYQQADPGNRGRLRRAFPEVAEVMDPIMDTMTGVVDLQDKLGVPRDGR